MLLHARPAVLHALTTERFRVRDLPGNLDDAGKLVLVRRLIREGLLQPLDQTQMPRGPVKPCSKSLAKFASPRLELPGCKAWAPHLGALVSCDALIDMVRQLGDRLTVGHRSSADFVSITSAWALQSLLDEAETYREQPSIL